MVVANLLSRPRELAVQVVNQRVRPEKNARQALCQANPGVAAHDMGTLVHEHVAKRVADIASARPSGSTTRGRNRPIATGPHTAGEVMIGGSGRLPSAARSAARTGPWRTGSSGRADRERSPAAATPAAVRPRPAKATAAQSKVRPPIKALPWRITSGAAAEVRLYRPDPRRDIAERLRQLGFSRDGRERARRCSCQGIGRRRCVVRFLSVAASIGDVDLGPAAG